MSDASISESLKRYGSRSVPSLHSTNQWPSVTNGFLKEASFELIAKRSRRKSPVYCLMKNLARLRETDMEDEELLHELAKLSSTNEFKH